VSPRKGKKGDGGRVVEIGAKRQSCDPFTVLLLRLVLQVVNVVADNMHQVEPTS